MFKIKTMNAIAEKGLDELKAEKCAVSPEMSAPGRASHPLGQAARRRIQ